MSDYEKVLDFIRRGEVLQNTDVKNGMGLTYVDGPNYDAWMSEIKIFNDRVLISHPLHNDISTTCFHRKNIHSYNDMMGHLRALANDKEFFEAEDNSAMRSNKTIDQMLAEDIDRCEKYLEQPDNDNVGQLLYVEITGKYDSIIDGFGNGLYQYYADQHFYDPEISRESLIHNLRVLHAKMVSYQAAHFSVAETNVARGKPRIMYDVFISHANADKLEYVDQLKQSLDKLRVNVFYDKDTLEWGDKWKDKVLEGVGRAEFAIIVISENFFGREWTERELNELLNRQNSSGQKIILPILHKISSAQLKAQYPAVADIHTLNSDDYSCDEIALKFAGQLIKRLKA